MDSPKTDLNPPFVGNFGSSSRPVLTILVILMLLRFVFAFLSGCVFPVEGVFVMCRPFSACHLKGQIAMTLVELLWISMYNGIIYTNLH